MSKHFDALSKKLESLADPSRLLIFILIARESNHCDLMESPPLSGNCTIRLAKLTGLSQATVSHHLSKLSEADLISSKRKGKFIFYFPKSDKLEHFRNFINSILENTQSFPSKDYYLGRQKQFSKKIFQQLVEFLQLHEIPITGPTTTAEGEELYHFKFTYRYLITINFNSKGQIFLRMPEKLDKEDEKLISEVLKKATDFLAAKSSLDD